MKTWTFFSKIMPRLELYIEFPSICRGRRFYERTRDGTNTLVWIGVIHAVLSRLPSGKGGSHENQKPVQVVPWH